MNARRADIPITSKMPPQVARVAKFLNSLKLSPDPVNPRQSVPGEGAYMGIGRAERLVEKIRKITGPLHGKGIVDIGCGPVDEEKRTGLLQALMSMNSGFVAYMGIDPLIRARFLGEQGTEAQSVVYLPVSIFELDEQTVNAIGKFDLVFSSMLFGMPLTSASVNKLIIKMLKEGTHIDEMPQFQEISNFLEFAVQDYCRKLVKENGFVVHSILAGEQELNIQMTEAAGLELAHKEDEQDEIDQLFVFRPG